jgi:tensin
LNTVNIENKNGLEGINLALKNTKAFVNKDSSQLLLIQFKVTSQGITITDLNRKKFLRQNFPVNTVLYCAVDENLTWPQKVDKIAKPRYINNFICLFF